MFIGIDLGTSAVKLVLVDADQRLLAIASQHLRPVQPHPLWSEDDPEAWWAAVERGLDLLSLEHALEGVKAIGLSGQMHGVVLLDAADQPVRPAILWNDGRSFAEAQGLASDEALQRRVGVRPMAGLSGPKFLWLARHEPRALARTRHMLLPKDYIRLKLTGERATDVSDAAGTWLLDQEQRNWSAEAIAACGVDRAWLPKLHESRQPTGTLRREAALRWGMGKGTVVAAGAGDAMAGGLGIGCIDEGQAFLSLGTSAQIFVVDSLYRPDPAPLVHSFCHAVPQRWCRMAAMLNGASPLQALAEWLGVPDIGALLAEVEDCYAGPSRLLALPYLSGERTPHNDPFARGVIFGLETGTKRSDIVQAMLEGVAFSLRDGLDALQRSGVHLSELGYIGGGTRSPIWGRIIASVLGVTLLHYESAYRGPAFGAARLARLSISGEAVADVATAPAIECRITPDSRLHDAYAARLPAFRALYQALKSEFLPDAGAGPKGPAVAV